MESKDVHGSSAEAEERLRAELKITIQRCGATHSDTAECYNRLGKLLFDSGRTAEAGRCFERAVEILERPENARRASMAASFLNLAESYKDQGRKLEAEFYFEKAARESARLLGSENFTTGVCLANLGELRFERGGAGDAVAPLERAHEIFVTSLGGAHPQVARTRALLGAVYSHLGEYTKADGLVSAALALYEAVVGEDDEVIRQILTIAESYRKSDDLDRAVELVETARDTLVQRRTAPAGGVAEHVGLVLADLYFSCERYEESIGEYQKVIDIFLQQPEKNAADLSRAQGHLAEVHRALGNAAQYLQFARDSWLSSTRAAGMSPAEKRASALRAAVAHMDAQDHQGALRLLRPLIHELENTAGPEHPPLANLYDYEAQCLRSLGDLGAALASEKRANEVRAHQRPGM